MKTKTGYHGDKIVFWEDLGKLSDEVSDAAGADPALMEIEVLVKVASPVALANSV